MSIFMILGLLVCIQTPGSSAGTPVFVQKGEDLTLNLMTADVPENFILFSWNFNENLNLITFLPSNKPIISNLYTGRVEVSEEKFSVKLKNLQKADSGVYTARVRGTEEEQTVAEYDVRVQDPVSPVELKVDSVSNSSDSCNLTVTCRTQDSHISSTFTCDTNTCGQEGGERSEVTTSGASLHVYLVNDSIICNHSNQVSHTKDMTKILQFCPENDGSEFVSAGVSVCLVKTLVFSVGLIIMVSAVVSVHIMEKLKKQK
ncbi:CD48 antigen-like [Symphorus nematophorus]